MDFIFLLIRDFVASPSMGYLENIGSLTCVDFQMLTCLLYNAPPQKKITFVNITLSSA